MVTGHRLEKPMTPMECPLSDAEILGTRSMLSLVPVDSDVSVQIAQIMCRI